MLSADRFEANAKFIASIKVNTIRHAFKAKMN